MISSVSSSSSKQKAMEGFERQFDAKSKLDEKIDYSNLPCPVPYEELRLEASMALKPELFEGFRFDFVKSMNQKFCISHGLSMGPTELPTELFTTPQTEIIKIPTSSYEFGAHFIDPKLLLVGRIMTDGRLNGRLKYDLTDNFSIKSNAQLTNEEGMSQGIIGFDYKGSDYRTQLQLGNGTLVVANYIQHVTPKLSLGGEAYWSGQQLKSGVDIGARYETDKMIASGQVSSNGVAFMNYVQKISERVSFAADFMYNYVSKEVSASVGYDYILRHCRLRGKIDSNGVASSHLEERLSNELGFVLSGEVDHMKKDYKFGFGVNLNL